MLHPAWHLPCLLRPRVEGPLLGAQRRLQHPPHSKWPGCPGWPTEAQLGSSRLTGVPSPLGKGRSDGSVGAQGTAGQRPETQLCCG